MPNLFDIKFLRWGHSPECDARLSQYFDYYVLDFALSGSLELSLDHAPPVILSGPVAWLTFPGMHFRFGDLDEKGYRWNHRYVAFHGPFADEILRWKLFPMHYPIINIYNAPRFVRVFDNLLNYLGDPVLGYDRAVIMLEGLLLQLHEQDAEMQFDHMDSRVKNLADEVRKNPNKDWNFRHEAEKLHLSYSHLRKLFHDGIRQPLNAFLIAEKMNAAAGMLVNTDLTIAEIAEQCGFEDIYHFSKTFKKHHNFPPGKYRKQAMF